MAVGKKLNFPPAFYARIPVEQLSKQEMDKALANGYYRNGIDFCTTTARFMGARWASSVMLRLPIEGFEFKKRHRKIMRTNNERFTHSFQPFQSTPEKEALWHQYKSGVHRWEFVPSLEHHLLRGQSACNYSLWELTVMDKGKLVAYAAFDWGSTSLASLEAAYDPDFGSYSLGFYTMLLEIQFCQAQQLAFYYPGFFPKNDPMFDYKLRPGAMQFFRLRTKKWVPKSELVPADWLLDEVLSKLESLKMELMAVNCRVVMGFSNCLHRPTRNPLITSSNIQLLVPLKSPNGEPVTLSVTWDALVGTYRVFLGAALSPPLPNDHSTVHFFRSIQETDKLGTYQKVEEIVMLAQAALANP